MAIKGMAQAMRNLDALDRRAVPRAAATTLNRVAESIIAKTASSVARELAVPRPSHPCPYPFKSGTGRQGQRKGLHQYR
ncbi:phage tail protein [Escherichia coli]